MDIRTGTSSPDDANTVEIGLNAAVVAMIEGIPSLLVVSAENTDNRDALPYGRFNPLEHRTMEIGVRGLVEEQAGLQLGYIEQLYTFGDRGRHRQQDDRSPHVVSVGYLALARLQSEQMSRISLAGAAWRSWYRFLPWEDWRSGRPEILDDAILPALEDWLSGNRSYGAPPPTRSAATSQRTRVKIAFGLEDLPWDDELVLDRYELIYSAGLVEEAVSDGRIETTGLAQPLGLPMLHDHRRILATAMSRLRGKLKYRPVIFELMEDEFTLYSLQQAVESIAGRSLHKQNFRRLVESNELVEPTGKLAPVSVGRPAALFRFRRAVMAERPAPGLKLGR